MEILILLVKRKGQLLTRTEIAAEIWPDADPEDVFANINVAVNRVRSALQDDASQPIFIQTVIGKGYRFIAPVDERIVAQHSEHDAITQASSAAAEDESLVSHSVQKRNAVSQIWGASLIVMLICGAAVVWLLSRYRHSSHNRSVTSFQRLTNFSTEDAVTAASISPDGKKFAYWDADGLLIRDFPTNGSPMGDGQPLSTPALRGVDRIEWFADNTDLLVSGWNQTTNNPEIWTISLTGSTPKLFQGNATLGVPSPDSQQIAYLTKQNTQVWVTNRSAGTARMVLAGAPGESFPVISWSSDGTKLLLARRTPAVESVISSDRFRDNVRYTYLAVRVSDDQITASQKGIRFNHVCALAGNRLLMTTPEWLDDGVTSSVWEVDVDAASGALRSTPQQVAWLWDYRTLSLSSAQTTGQTIAVLRKGRPAVYYADLKEHSTRLSDIKRLNANLETAYPHGWTDDSRSVLYEARSGPNWNIYRQNLDRHNPQTLAELPGHSAYPRMSGDGKWVLFINRPSPDDPYTLYRVRAQGGPSVTVPANGVMQDFRCPSRTSWCVLRETEGTEFIYYSLDPVKGKGAIMAKTPKPENFLAEWDVSPDGSQLAYVASRVPDARLKIVSLRSENEQTREISVQTSTNIKSLSWEMDGTGWFLAVETAVGSNLLHCEPNGKTSILFSSPGATWAVPSPDGKRIAFVNQYVDSNLWQVSLP